MGNAGEHQLTLSPCLLHVFGHLVECAVNLGHLTGRIADRQAHTAPLAQLPGSENQALERLVELAHKNPGRGRGQKADCQKPAQHAPDFLPAQWMRVKRHFQPTITQAWRPHP
ncbi:hypothetical protein D3C76_1009920 [compost metagenome]